MSEQITGWQPTAPKTQLESSKVLKAGWCRLSQPRLQKLTTQAIRFWRERTNSSRNSPKQSRFCCLRRSLSRWQWASTNLGCSVGRTTLDLTTWGKVARDSVDVERWAGADTVPAGNFGSGTVAVAEFQAKCCKGVPLQHDIQKLTYIAGIVERCENWWKSVMSGS